MALSGCGFLGLLFLGNTPTALASSFMVLLICFLRVVSVIVLSVFLYCSIAFLMLILRLWLSNAFLREVLVVAIIFWSASSSLLPKSVSCSRVFVVSVLRSVAGEDCLFYFGCLSERSTFFTGIACGEVDVTSENSLLILSFAVFSKNALSGSFL